MKTLAAALCGVLVLGMHASAAQPYEMGLGAHLRLKAGVNTASIPEGEKTFTTFNGIPDFGATFYVPFDKENNIGAIFEAGYLTNSYGQRFLAAGLLPDIDATVKLNYIGISPNISLGVFSLGMELGIPVGGSISVPGFETSFLGQKFTTPDTTVSIKSDSMAVLVGLRAGVAIPLMQDENGRLNLVILGSYALTGAVKNFSETDINGRPLSDSYNPKPVSLSIGVSYLFSLRKK